MALFIVHMCTINTHSPLLKVIEGHVDVTRVCQPPTLLGDYAPQPRVPKTLWGVVRAQMWLPPLHGSSNDFYRLYLADSRKT